MIHTINFNKGLRLLVCLLLVCCLIVNISPIRAKAAATYEVGLIETVSVIGSILIGLGILPDVDFSAFNILVNRIVSGLSLTEFIEVATWVASGFQKYAVPQWLIDSVRSYVFTEQVVTTKNVSPSTFISAGTQVTSNDYGTVSTWTINTDSFAFSVGRTLLVFNVAGGHPSVTKPDGSKATTYYRKTDVGTVYYVQIPVASDYYKTLGVPLVTGYTFSYDAVDAYWNGEFEFSPIEQIAVSSGLVAGLIAGQKLSFSDGYATWASGAVSVPGTVVGEETDTEVVYVPVGIGGTYSSTIAQTQEQVQAATGTAVDSSPDDGTDGSVSESWLAIQLAVIFEWFSRLLDGINLMPSSFSAFFDNVISAIKSIPGSFADWFADVLEGIQAIPGAFSDWFEAVKAKLDSIVDSLKNTFVQTQLGALVEFFTGTAYVESPLVAIQFPALFDLFPFNIPYGIYQAVTFWSAGAVAPTITIPLPTISGGSVDVYEYDINFADIPGMDALASIIRAGELILFVVGLAMVTRKVTKW